MSTEAKSNNEHKRGSCCACLSIISNDVKQLDSDALGDAETQAALVTEKAIDSTVSRIKGSLSWASAGLLGIAISSTIEISFGGDNDPKWMTVLADWVYVLVLVLIEVFLQTCTIDAIDAPDSIGKELDTTVPPKKAKRGDTVAKYELEEQIKKKKKEKTDRSRRGVASKILRFAEKTTDRFLENMAALGTAILANVIAVALNSAVTDTFKWIINSDSLTIALYWTFALIMTGITCRIALTTGKEMDDREISLYDFVYKCARENNITSREEIWTNEHVYGRVVRFGARKRFINLVNHTFGLSMAWAWQGAMKETIIDAYNGDSESVTGMWFFVLVASLIVAFFNAIGEKYYFLYPRDNSSSLQMDTKERDFLATAVSKNAKVVVGVAWYDAAVNTSNVTLNKWDNVIMLWVVYIVFLTGSILGEFYWQKVWLKVEMIEKGVVTAVYRAYSNLWDADRDLEVDEEEKEKNETTTYEFGVLYGKESIELSIYAWGIAAGWTASAAVKAFIIEIYGGTFDPDTTEDVEGEVLASAWAAFFIALLVSTLIMYVLSRYQKRKQKERKKKLKKAAGEDGDKTAEEKNTKLKVRDGSDEDAAGSGGAVADAIEEEDVAATLTSKKKENEEE